MRVSPSGVFPARRPAANHLAGGGAIRHNRGMRRGRVGLTVGAVAAIALTASAIRLQRSRHTLPAQIRVDDDVADLTTLDGATVEGPAARVDWLRINARLDGKGEYRQAIAALPGTVVRHRVWVPQDGMLKLAVGVAEVSRGTRRPPVRFAVDVDGREIYTRTVEPGANGRKEDRWLPVRLDLAGVAERDVTISLRTEAAGDGPVTAAWSRIRLVRTHAIARQSASRTTPNVLLVLLDTVRADALGAYGAPGAPTPVLDAFAGRGVLFEQAVAQAPWTIPSVTTYFTGLHPTAHGVIGGQWRRTDKHDPTFASRFFLADRIPTLAELAQRAGITTAGVTANNLISFTTNIARGFEYWKEPTGRRDGTKFPRAHVVNELFLRWLDDNRGRRFFGYVHYMDVHSPYDPPAEFLPPDDPTLPDDVRRGVTEAYIGKRDPLSPAATAYLRARYDGALHYADREVGRLLDGLRTRGLLDSTIVVVVADHGEGFGEHGFVGHCVTLYDELLHVPLMIAGPGIAGPRRDHVQAQGIDLLPTLAALLGIPRPDGALGHDLLRSRPDEPAFAHTALFPRPDGERGDLLAWRTPERKVIHEPAATRSESYDLTADPTERANRYASDPQAAPAVAALRRHFDTARATTTAIAGPSAPASLRDRLTALGYLGD